MIWQACAKALLSCAAFLCQIDDDQLLLQVVDWWMRSHLVTQISTILFEPLFGIYLTRLPSLSVVPRQYPDHRQDTPLHAAAANGNVAVYIAFYLTSIA